MSTKFDSSDSKALVVFHFQSLQGMYFSEYRVCDGYVLLFSDLVEDSYYNYISQVNRDLEAVLREARPLFLERNRPLALYVTPCSRLYDKEPPDAFAKWAIDAWMVSYDMSKLADYQYPVDIAIELVGIEEREEFVRVFEQAYGSDDPDDPYGKLPAYYGQSLFRSFEGSPEGYKTEYIWAKIDGKPVGVASMLSDGKIAGVYSVGTISAYRRRGVGTSLMAFLVKQAKERGISTIMFQTEVGSYNEKWYTKMGFKTVFTGTYYVEKT